MEQPGKCSIKLCKICNVNVPKAVWARHQLMKKHLKTWAEKEGIHNFEEKTPQQLSKIRQMLETRSKDFSAFNYNKLRQLAAERKLEITKDMPREKILKRLQKVDGCGDTKLYLFNLSYIQEKARRFGIPFISRKSKDDLIKAIHDKRGMFYCIPCKVATKDQEVHETTEKHCLKTGRGLTDFSESSKTGKFKTTIFNNVRREDDPLEDILSFLDSLAPKIIDKLTEYAQDKQNIKMGLSLECEYERERLDEGKQKTIMTFNTKMKAIFQADDLPTTVRVHFEDLKTKESRHQPNQGSGWSLCRIVRLMLKAVEFNPLTGSSYIELPKWVKDKHACINILNKDDKCFIYSVLCALNEPYPHSERPNHYTDRLNDGIFKGFQYPMPLKDIKKFELRSHSKEYHSYPSMAVNVFEIGSPKKKTNGEQGEDFDLDEEKEDTSGSNHQPQKQNGDIHPILISEHNETAEKIIDLLLVSNKDKSHYIYIKNLSRLVHSQITKRNGAVSICRRCLSHFYSQARLDLHKEYCNDHEPCVMRMPQPGTTVHFKNHVHKFKHPYIIYADFETLNIENTQSVLSMSATTKKVKKHVPYGFAIYLVSRVNNEKFKPFVYRATTQEELSYVPKTFVKCLNKILLYIADKYSKPKKLNLTAEEENSFQRATSCHICEAPFEIDDVRARDHCHLEGTYLGPSHVRCNLDRSIITKIPVVLHNLSNFDSHLFVEELFHYKKNSKMTVIASTEEKYITFQKNMFRIPSSGKNSKIFKLSFIDSFRFLGASLEKLSSNLQRSQMHHLNRFISKHAKSYLSLDKNRAFQILRSKGIFPYDYVNSLERLNENNLLDKHHFYDSLNDSIISDVDYLIYKLVWNHLSNRSLGTYSDLYNIQDILLLADIFENFRDVCLENYHLDPAYYLTAPSLAWDAMLKMTESNVELISDPDMHLMVERGIRGGISQVCKRHVIANNKYLENFDESKPVKFLMYLDACNLYGWALSEPLPYQHFEWIDPQLFTIEQWTSHIKQLNVSNSDKAYILEADLEYPQHLHNLHNDIPFAAHHHNNKLCTTLLNREKYVVHIRTLQQMLKHGLILKKVHRVIEFTQKPFIKKYVEFNSGKRQMAKNEFEKNFYKLMVNSVFGRTMMNLRKRQNIKLCNETQALKLSKKPAFSRFTLFNNDFLAVHMLKNKLYLNQPIQVGCAVLEISKTLMYDFWYDKLKVWDPKANLVLMDTDSYLVEMGQNPYEIIGAHLDDFDTSNYPTNHSLYTNVNKNVPGKMKDELGGIPMTEICGLRAKLYTYLYRTKNVGREKSEIRCKGVKKNVAKKTIRMEHFKAALYENKDLYRQVSNIRSFKHILYTEKQLKLALSAKDDKRFILENKVETLPWGHWDIPSRDEPVKVD